MKTFTLSFLKNWKPVLRSGITLRSREARFVSAKSFEVAYAEEIGKGLTLGDESGKARTIFMDPTNTAHAALGVMHSAFIGRDGKGNPAFAKADNPKATATLVYIRTAVQHRAPRIVNGELHRYGGEVRKLQGKPWFVATGHTSRTDYVGRKPVESRNYDALVALAIGDAVEIWPEGQNGSLVLANTKECGLQLFTRDQFAEWSAPASAKAPAGEPTATPDVAQSA